VRRHRFLPVVITLLLVLGGAACGDDDDEDGAAATTTTAAEGAGDEEGSDEISIDYVDYGYVVSGAVKAGGTLNIANKGKEFHMLGIGKFKAGKTFEDLQAALQQGGEGEGGPEEDPTADIIDGIPAPGNFVGPGQSARITAPSLAAGQYALMCFLNVEGEDTPHFARGMIGELTVVDEKAPEPEADFTYTAEKGKPLQGPASIPSGRQILKIQAAGENGGDLEPGIYKLNPGVTPEQFGEAAKVLDEGFPKDAASKVPGQFIIGSFDFGESEAIYLEVDFEKGGNYVMSADDTDDDEEPLAPVELLKLTVT
jgi:hypothetical protein